MKKLALVCITISSFGLFGCKSTPVQIDAQPLMTNHSEAYNIANQTALLRDKSPLKDFTIEEVADIETELNKQSNGGKYVAALGALSVLSGNLTGVIDIAGGSASMIANSDHASAYSRWIVAIPKSEFSDIGQAQKYMLSEIENAAIQYFGQYGKVYFGDSSLSGHINLFLDYEGQKINLGLYSNPHFQDNVHGVETYWNVTDEDVYLFGAAKRAYVTSEVAIGPPALSHLLVNKVTDKSYSQIQKEFTAYLPSGFYMYIPSFPQQYIHGEGKYQALNHIVPSIYTEGRQLDFIKP
ncbi:hypothetical protein ST37_10510 [Vibrio sp. qd031]|uniref:hypothetical protein n=1 Tax=Vibrio sp. qd031 TaxID=1603038 RepID=UPI000A217B91|nr:hypothetical protein [Vibrio sp. qd031]ORT50304.1 hypothetical protein ST37_10510 [Vibrio sp. qd031]